MDKKNWDRFAPIYNAFMNKDQKAYDDMYQLIRKQVKNKTVLELATGTGLIAKNIESEARQIDATDYSEKMIKEAMKCHHSDKLRFSVENACHLSFASDYYDVVIISNALHIMSEPEKALKEIDRVLNETGILIAPTFTHGNMTLSKRILSKLMGVVGFEAQQKWTTNQYVQFLKDNGWKVNKVTALRASFPLTYVECSRKK